MTREQVLEKINLFRSECKAYKRLLLDSRAEIMPDIIRNHDEIDEMRSKLNRIYLSVERYVELFGNNPSMSDGVWKMVYSPYTNAFTSDILIRRGRSLDAVIDDLDIVIGRIESATDIEFDEKVNPPKPKEKEANLSGATIIANGGDGGSGLGGGHGGNGGMAIFAQIVPPVEVKESSKIENIKNVHQEYWSLLFSRFFSWIIAHTFKLIGALLFGLLLAYLIFRFGWN